jgi:peptide/nickel transport system permease protein
MLRFAGKKLLAVIPLLLILSFVSYVLVDLIPGDAAASIAGEQASPAQLAALRDHLGLGDPLPVRYVRFLDHAVHGDLGTSVINSQPVSETIARRLPVTLSLLIVTLLLVVIVSVPVGMLAALRPNSVVDRAVTVIAGVILSVPSFVVGLLLVTYLAVDRSWFPATGYQSPSDGVFGWLSHLILPAIALALHPIAELTRQTRGAMRDVLDEDYVRTARAHGLRSSAIVFKWAGKNTAITVVTVLGLMAARLIGGAAVVEAIFNLPGIGTLAIDAVTARDISMIQGIVLLAGVVVIAVNLIVDLSYAWFNPRVRAL